MRAEASGIEGVELAGPGTPAFFAALEALDQSSPDEALRAAFHYSVIVANRTERSIALLGVRFDMIGRSGKACSVVHYADTLRYPEQAIIAPGSARLVCAEPLYTDRVLGREPASPEAAARARMNLDNLRHASNHRAAIDCIAFADGEFHGPDSRGAFERLAAERKSEENLLRVVGAGVLSDSHLEILLDRERADEKAPRARRNLAGRLRAVFDGAEGNRRGAQTVEYARSHRTRIPLWRP